MKKFYITTAIDYVNGKPHIGHTLEKVQADVAARYHRLKGDDVYYLTGTDEHGAKIARSAEKAGKPVEKYAAENAKAFQEAWDNLNISYDYFIRTSNKTRHWPSVRKVWQGLAANDDIYKKSYTGLYCVGHEAFVTKKDLNKEGKCEIHDAEPEKVEEENYFFKLSKYTKKVEKAIKSGEMKIVPKSRENEILKLAEKGFEDVSFSRPSKDLKWGVPVPRDKSQTIYVWADALTNYISALGWGTSNDKKYKKYWPADVQVIGKDILRFHAAIWPGILLSLGLPLPKKLFVHGFINVEGKKLSKTLGNVIDPNEIVEKYGADALRYYMLSEIQPTKDGDFSVEKFEARYNGDLALGLGNLLARITSLGEKYLDKPLESKLTSVSQKELDKRWKAYEGYMEELQFSDAIREVSALISYADKRINDTKLWVLAKEDAGKFKEEISDVATILAYVAWMLTPVIPTTSEKVFNQLGIKPGAKKTWKFKMEKGEALFPRLE
ncbi:MAG: class I tRNA ligase family protein [Candidatus Spechtbacterales bacterium]|nr:class I tRNA ligase family protein [Candidatus Spechtbacterales bacterium]